MSEIHKLEKVIDCKENQIRNQKVRINELKIENNKLADDIDCLNLAIEAKETEIAQLKETNKRLTEQLATANYDKFIVSAMTDWEAAAMLAQLKNEPVQSIPGEPLPTEKLIELAEWKKEAEIYKAMYMQLLKYHIGDCANG